MKRLPMWVTLLASVSSALKSAGKTKTTVLAQKNAEINIFTVASGLLYEVRICGLNYMATLSLYQRFASIMILSVLRNTKHTVKFWFIENFLSPSFLVKHFVPYYPVAILNILLRSLFLTSRRSTASSMSLLPTNGQHG